MAPLNLLTDYGTLIAYITALLIGVGFGASLEMSGFGDSRKLSAQFYFKDMTVLKVMFTGIIVAMTLIFLFSSFELLDFTKVYVTKTFLVPGIIGGLIMGVGFIIGGFCPGTSLVAAATFKIDGIFFLIGTFLGVFLYGESLSLFANFHNSTYMGKFTLPELLNLDTGVVVLLVLIMAFLMFYGGEIAEKMFGEKLKWSEFSKIPKINFKFYGSALLIFLALITIINGEPTIDDKWEWIKKVELKKMKNREMYIHPGELLETINDPMLYSIVLDMRSDSDYNLFHIEDSMLTTIKQIKEKRNDFTKKLEGVSSNTVIILVSNNEKNSTEAYKLLKARGIINLYILSGGINNWINLYHINKSIAIKSSVPLEKNSDKLNYIFKKAVGSSTPLSNPVLHTHTHGHIPEFKYVKKIKIQKRKLLTGGCG